MKLGPSSFLLRSVVIAALVAASLMASAAAQQVSAEAAPPVTVRAGSTATAQLIFHVADGYHINSNHPKSDLLIPTRLEFSRSNTVPLHIASIHYPVGSTLRLSFDPKDPLDVYSGSFIVAAEVRALLRAAPGDYTLKGSLNYQACSDRACYPPRELPVSVQVHVVGAR